MDERQNPSPTAQGQKADENGFSSETNAYNLTSKLCPVISAGCGSPRRKSNVGATSARMPSSTRNCAESAATDQISEVMVWAVSDEPSRSRTSSSATSRRPTGESRAWVTPATFCITQVLILPDSHSWHFKSRRSLPGWSGWQRRTPYTDLRRAIIRRAGSSSYEPMVNARVVRVTAGNESSLIDSVEGRKR